MTTVVADISVSLDGFVTGPDAGPDNGLGTGGEPLHTWVLESDDPVDAEILARSTERSGAVVMGRNLFDVIDVPSGWSDEMGYGAQHAARPPFLVVTHEPPTDVRLKLDFRFVADVPTAIEQAQAVAGDKDVFVMGGGEIIRQSVDAGLVDEPCSTSPRCCSAPARRCSSTPPGASSCSGGSVRPARPSTSPTTCARHVPSPRRRRRALPASPASSFVCDASPQHPPQVARSVCLLPAPFVATERRPLPAGRSAFLSPRCLGGGDSARRLGVRPCGRAIELESNERLITGDPRVVPRFDHIRVAFADVLFGSVIVDDVHTPANDGPHVVDLTAVRAGDRLDAIGPTPAGLRGHPRRFDSTEIDNLQTGLVRCPDLIRRPEALLDDSSHLNLPSRGPQLGSSYCPMRVRQASASRPQPIFMSAVIGEYLHNDANR